MKIFCRLSSILILTLLVLACDESDKFSSDSGLRLEYSQDALRFDTVFTTVLSPVQRVKVYNRNDNSISISSIKLMNPETSGFRINVDGQAGTEFQDVDLLRKDSLYIMVDVKADALNGASPVIKDAIELSWNGNTEQIQLEAYAIDVDIWNDKTIDSDTRLTADRGYYIKGKVSVAPNATLTIEEGTTLYFDQKGSLNIEGKIIARGTAGKRITFRGHRFDLIERNVPYDNASGQWRGITIGANSYHNVLENVNIRNSGIGIDFVSSSPDRKKATLVNSIVHNTSEYGIKAVNCNIEAMNCLFSNSAAGVLTLAGGRYSFLHCTIANYYRWHPRTTPCVTLTDIAGQEKYPLSECDFANSIVAGTFRDELEMIFTQENNSIQFSNCLIQSSKALDDKRFQNTIWNIESVFLFKDLNTEGQYFYNFELPEGSTARDAANIDAAQKAPTDLRGISRFSDSKPDIGCYEWYKDE